MKAFLIGAIRFYQVYLSPLKPPCCRFVPTCSEYALEAIQKYGPVKGSWLAVKRISKCHPFTKAAMIPYREGLLFLFTDFAGGRRK